MSDLPTIDAEVTLLRTDEGGRRGPILPGLKPSHYCPHLVIGDPTQRKAIVREGNVCTEEYLGIRFLDGPDIVYPGDWCVATMSLMYHPDVDYSAVIPGATFTVREGGMVIGFGRVIKRSDVN
jgi:translation elongation factor EF-Tu-like GTPase